MNRLWSFFLLLVFCHSAGAESYRRSVNFEWEPISAARAYEVHITQKRSEGEGKTFSFKTKEAVFNGKLNPGRYTMKLRSLDNRGVPGPWSQPADFDVALEPVRVKFPTKDLIAKEPSEETLNFQWQGVGGAEGYRVEVSSEDGKFNQNVETKDTSIKLKLPVGAKLNWKVNALGAAGLNSESVSTTSFTLKGKKLEKPRIEKPETEFVREVKWSRPDNSENFDFVISRYDKKSKQWQRIQKFENQLEEKVGFDEKWPGGKYKISLRANATHRESSDVVSQIFDVHNGNRSPAAEYTATVRKSIDRINGWYAVASYLITQMNYKSTHRVFDINYGALGGTGRVGAGWFSNNSPWGFLSIVDLGGFVYESKVSTFASAEISGIYRKHFGERDEFRIHTGVFFKEVPQTIPDYGTMTTNSADSSSSLQTVNSKQSVLGPHVGAEYWYSLSPKLGLQLNTHLYYGMLKMSTPSGGENVPRLSTQVGLMGSYRMSSRFTGLLGLTLREDKASYKDSQVIPTAPAGTSEDIDTTISGYYLSLFAEYAF